MSKAAQSTTTTEAPFPPAQKPAGGRQPTQATGVSPAQAERLVGARERLATVVERLIAVLDTMDVDPDIEEDDFGGGDANDAGEASLGSVAVNERNSQEGWSAGLNTDAEGDEHDGAEPDEDGEPSLGATHAVSQLAAWHESHVGGWWGSGDGEPTLGAVEGDHLNGWSGPTPFSHDGREPNVDDEPAYLHA